MWQSPAMRRAINIKLLVVWVSLSMTTLCTASANAQVTIDMRLITCRQYLDEDSHDRDVIDGWVSGFINAAKGQGTVDITKFEGNRALVDEYCRRHKSEALMNAIQVNSR
jgi:acid stress chaperone HdeB